MNYYNGKELTQNELAVLFIEKTNAELKERSDTDGWLLKAASNATFGEGLFNDENFDGTLPDNLTVFTSRVFKLPASVKRLPENLTVIGSLNIKGTKIEELPASLVVTGYIDADNSALKRIPDNSYFEGYLSIVGTSCELPRNAVINAVFYSNCTDDVYEASNLGNRIRYEHIPCNGLEIGAYGSFENSRNFAVDYLGVKGLIGWRDGKIVYVDGITSEVVSKHGNVFKVRNLHSYNTIKEGFIVTDGNGVFAHGDTVEQAKEDITFKLAEKKLNELDVESFSNMTLDTVVSHVDAVMMYRKITGACRVGVDAFIESNIEHKKDSYTIKELIELTAGNYGSDMFVQFFNKAAKQEEPDTDNATDA